MDAQTTLGDTAAIAALVQSIVRAEVEEGADLRRRDRRQEVLAENRFLAARDGMDAELIEPELGERVPARALLADLLAVCRPHAQELGCAAELDGVIRSADRTGARRQLELSPLRWDRCRASSPCWRTTSSPRQSDQRSVARRDDELGDDQVRGELRRRRRGSARSGPRSTTVLRPACRASPRRRSRRRAGPTPKTFSFSSIVVKSWPGGMLRKVAQAATVSPSAVQTPPWTNPPGCRWRRVDDDPAARVRRRSISSGSIPRSPGKLPLANSRISLRRDLGHVSHRIERVTPIETLRPRSARRSSPRPGRRRRTSSRGRPGGRRSPSR